MVSTQLPDLLSSQPAALKVRPREGAPYDTRNMPLYTYRRDRCYLPIYPVGPGDSMKGSTLFNSPLSHERKNCSLLFSASFALNQVHDEDERKATTVTISFFPDAATLLTVLLVLQHTSPPFFAFFTRALDSYDIEAPPVFETGRERERPVT